jgi:hypothetical protein
MIDRININEIQDLVGKVLSKQPSPTKSPINSGLDVSLQADYASLIKKATQIPQADSQAVQRAQKALLSGQLESRQSIRAAAEKIRESGI